MGDIKIRDEKVSGMLKLAVAGTLTMVTSSQGLLTTASKESDGTYGYNFGTVPLLGEGRGGGGGGGENEEKGIVVVLNFSKKAVKFIVSCVLLRMQIKKDPKTKMTRSFRHLMLFMIPSIIYTVHNNVQFVFLEYVEPSTYQILGNLKIVTTGILFRIFLGRHLSKMKWVGLVLLTVGATVSQLKGCDGAVLAAPFMGYVMALVSATLSATAGVYTEWILKKNDDHLYWSNCQLYGFGIIFNFIRLSMDAIFPGASPSSKLGISPFNIFHGYTVITWLVVANLSFSGLLISWIQKYADTIMKVYATSMSMVTTTILDYIIFANVASMQLIMGIITASCSLQIYYATQKDL